METVLTHFEGFAQLGVLLGMLATTLFSLATFAVYLLIFLPSSIQVYAPLLDGPPVPAAEPIPGSAAVVIPAQTVSSV